MGEKGAAQGSRVRARSALGGLLAAGVALGTGELVAGLAASLASPVVVVGNRVIEAVPQPVERFAIETFGTNDKLALVVGICLVAGLLGAATGLLARQRPALGAAGIAAFGVVGVWAAYGEVGAPPLALLPSVTAALAGIAALAVLVASVPGSARSATELPLPAPAGRALARRSFLQLGAGAAAIGLVAASSGRWLQGRVSAAASRLAVVLPRPARPLPPLDPGVELGLDGLAPFVTPNADFFRIDVNLVVPQVPAETWSLTVHGMVDRELRFSYEELLDLPMVEEDITLACVSNAVGGDLVGNARWLGVPLVHLLEGAGVDAAADQIVGRAVDGFTVGFPVRDGLDGRPALVAVGMNGEPLPIRHGFPARLVVSGLYGYVSATKWLTEIELTTFAAFDQYWARLGWAEEGPIHTMARIDTPRGLARVGPGPVAVAGVAWAQTRGIERVEVQVDDGPWTEAELAAAPSEHTWRQWVHRWEATPGRHELSARAVDGTGTLQTEQRADSFPAGATGWHRIQVLVDEPA